MCQDEKYQRFHGLTRLSPQIFLQDGEEPHDEAASSEHPRVIVIYGWGDGSLKHVAKYRDGFRQLYPNTKQIIVLSPMIQAMWQGTVQRTSSMMPVIEAAFPDGPQGGSVDSVLMHVMSSTGVINYAATLNAYRHIHGAALPHRMTSYDSTAGGSDFNCKILFQWSYALALSTTRWFPLPFFVVQFAWGIFICMSRFLDCVLSRESAGASSRRMMLHSKFVSRKVLKVYFYSREDKLVSWANIENEIARTKKVGYMVQCITFEGSGHVSHMRTHPELYWKALQEAWDTRRF